MLPNLKRYIILTSLAEDAIICLNFLDDHSFQFAEKVLNKLTIIDENYSNKYGVLNNSYENRL